MPNWKKLIVSGSDANLNSLDVTTDVTANKLIIKAASTYAAEHIMDSYNYVIQRNGSYGLSTFTVKNSSNQDILHLSGDAKLRTDSSSFISSKSIYAPHLGSFGFRTYGSTNAANVLELHDRTDNNNHGAKLVYQSSGTYSDGLVLGNDGKVGIGTTTPNTTLVVHGNSVAIQDGTKGIHVGKSYSDFGIFGASGVGSHYNPDKITLSAANRNSGNSGYIDIYSRYGTTAGTRGDISIVAGATATPLTSGSINFTTNNTQRAIIDFDGNVGIGTTSPSEKLEVDGNARITGDVTLSNGNALRWTSDDVRIEGTTAGDNIKFYVANTEILQLAQSGTLATITGNLTTTGNVGIGTTSPSEKLHIAGNMRLQNQLYDSTNSQGSIGQVLSKIAAGTQWASVSSLYTETDTLDSVTDRGATTTNDITIGNLEVNSNISTPNNTSLRLQPSGSSGWIFLGSPTDGTKIYHYSRGDNGQNTVYDFDAGYYKINTNATSGFNLTQDTKVSGDLTVTGKVTAQEFHTEFVSASIMYESGSTKFGDTSDDIHSFSGSLRVTGSGDHYFTDGNVGIGTTNPGSQKLHVVGDIKATNKIFVEDSTNSRLEFASSISNQARISAHKSNLGQTLPLLIQAEGIKFGTVGGGEKMRMDSSGNLGIGNPNPSEKLTIEGNISASGDFYIDGAIFDTSNVSGTSGQVLSSTATGTAWIDTDAFSSTSSEAVLIAVKNTSGGTIAEGTPVYETGTVGATETLTVSPADASDSTKMPAIGIVTSALNNNGQGYAIVTGIHKGITTSPIDGVTPTTNTTLYVKAGGGLTTVRPTGATNLIQNVGKVGKVSGGSAGSIVVSSIMRSNDIPNLPEGKVWVGSSNYTVTSSLVHLDEPNERMGIGTVSPSSKLEVISNDNVGTTKIISAYSLSESQSTSLGYNSIMGSYSLDVKTLSTQPIRFSPNSSETMRITSAGRVGIGNTNPTQKLDVGGNIRTNSNLYVYNSDLSKQSLRIKSEATTNTGLFKLSNGSNWGLLMKGHSNSPFIGTYYNGLVNITGFEDAEGTTPSAINLAKFYFGGTGGGSGYLVLNGDLKVNNNKKLQFGYANSQTNGIEWVHSSKISAAITPVDTANFARTGLGFFTGDFSDGTTNADERMRITRTGKVTIGTTSPSTVGGTAKMTVDVGSGTSSPISIVNGTTDGMYIRRYDANGQYQIQTTLGSGNTGNLSLQSYGGNVGIGTTTISGQEGAANGTPKLQVLKTGTTGLYDLVARFGTDQDENNSGASVLINAGNDRGLLVSAGRADSNRAIAHLNLIQYDGNELTDGLTIYQPDAGTSGATNGTNVGIGTTSPSEKLHVYKEGSSFIKVDSGATSPYLAGVEFLRSSINGGRIYNDGGAVQVKLESYYGYESANPTRGGFTFKTAPVTSGTLVDALRINALGDVGIGTSTPGYKLDVDLDSSTDRFNITREGTQKFYVNGNGNTITYGTLTSYGNTLGGGGGTFNYRGGVTNAAIGHRFMHVNNGSFEASSGEQIMMEVVPTIDQSSTAGYTGIKLNVTETATGSGDKNLLDLQVDGVSKYKVNSDGDIITSGDLTVAGKVTAQEFHTEFVSASILYESGSTKFGDTSDDIHSFSGSLRVTGSGDHYFTDGNLGIGTTSPGSTLPTDSETATKTLQLTGVSGNTGDTAVLLRSSDNSSGLDLWHNASTGDSYIDNRFNAAQGDTIFRVKTAGTPLEALRITGNGNVGIGTTSPGAKLHIDVVSEDNQPGFKLTKVSDSGENAMEVHHGTSSALRGIADFTNSNGSVMFLRGDGNVGIGTTSPSSKLQVSANDGDGITLQHGASNAFYILRSGNDDTIIKQTRNYTSKISISTLADSGTHESSGLNIVGQGVGLKSNIGIGTNSPSAKLDVRGGMIVAGDTPPSAYGATLEVYRNGNTSELLIHQDNGSATTKFAQLHFRNGGNDTYIKTPTSGQALIIDTESVTDAVGIRTDGRVGIGTITPSDKLHIDDGDVFVSNDSTNQYKWQYGPTQPVWSIGGGNYFTIKGGANRFVTLNSSGNFGIGTTNPGARLDIVASAIGLRVKKSDLSDVFRVYSNGAGIYTNNGNVHISDKLGIGTTSPSAKVDIEGDLQVKGVNISNQENLDVDTGTETIATVVKANYDAAFFDFVIKNGTNLRAGTVFAIHDGTNVEFTETSTNDLGDTSDVTLSVDISGTDMRLRATTTSDNWIIKSLVRTI